MGAGVSAAADAALDRIGSGSADDQLAAALVRRVAADVDAAETVRDRATAVKLLLELCDRLSLVPPAPGRAGGAGAADPPAPAAAGDEIDDNPFEVPDAPPAPPVRAGQP